MPGTSVQSGGEWSTGDTTVAVRDTAAGAETPYVFAWTPKNHLTVAWFG